MMRDMIVAGLLLGLGAGVGSAQSLADRVLGAPDGSVRMSFAAREGVGGNGVGHGYTLISRSRSEEWEPACEKGLVRVVMRVEGRHVTSIKTYVGGRWRASKSGRDLGEVTPEAAADFLLDLAADPANQDGEDAIFPATIAEGVTVWPRLLDLARDQALPRDTRRQAIFWTGQEAAREAGQGLEALIAADDEKVEIRSHAIFALSQQDDDEAVPALIRLVRDATHPVLRKRALFWLAQSDDSRVLALFEEILAGS